MDKTDALNIAHKYAETVKSAFDFQKIILFREKEFKISNPFVKEIITYGQEIV